MPYNGRVKEAGFFIIFFVGIGLLGTIVPAIVKPADRAFTGLEGYSEDWVGYTSYIEEGIYGRNTVAIRSLPPPQGQTIIHIIYPLAGRIGGLFRFSAPLTYHIFRATLGIFYASLVYLFFRRFLGKTLGLAAFLIASLCGTLGWLGTLSFTSNNALQWALRPHYLFGGILFLISVWIIVVDDRRYIMSVLCGFFLALVHPPFAILLGLLSAGIFLWRRQKSCVANLGGIVMGLGIIAWASWQYPLIWMLASETSVFSDRVSLSTIVNELITFGPNLWLGLPGLIVGTLRGKTRGVSQILLLWIILQFALFFFLYQFLHMQRVRFIQSLYFIPLAFGTILFLQTIANKWKKSWMVGAGVIILLLISVPSYIHDVRASITGTTTYANYDAYTTFIFPSYPMVAAYQWLNVHTPKESVVLAGFEGANNIIVYSHNYVIGNIQGWPPGKKEMMVRERDDFFRGTQPAEEARAYLARNQISFIYYGFQEKSLGNMSRYTFLKPVYANAEVTIFALQ